MAYHDAQILVVESMKLPLQKPAHKNKIRIVDEQTRAKFQMLLKEETWMLFTMLIMLIECLTVFTVSF
jgi:hypothetical protein